MPNLAALSPNQNKLVAPAETPWWITSLGNDWNRLIGSITSAVMAPSNAMSGKYNALVVNPDTGQVEPLNRQLLADAANMASVASVGSAGMVPEEALGMGIKAYHGSPHSFDRFDMSKIGTGEGAQAYGHGLYFAENENVAKAYRSQLSADRLSFDSLTPEESARIHPVAARKISDTGIYGDTMLDSEIYNVSQQIKDEMAALPTRKAPDYANERLSKLQDQLVALQKLKDSGDRTSRPAGATYQVDINAHPDQFLDWDKPLSEQPKAVQDVLKPLADKAVKQGLATGYDTAGEAYQAARGLFPAENDAASVSAALNAAGVKGIKYLDAGSRPTANFSVQQIPTGQVGAGEWGVIDSRNGSTSYFKTKGEADEFLKNQQSRNYVVFDDNLVNIEKKYGILGAALPQQQDNQNPAAKLKQLGNPNQQSPVEDLGAPEDVAALAAGQPAPRYRQIWELNA